MSVVTQTSNKTFRLVGSLCSVLAIVVGIPCLLMSWMPLFGAVAFYPSVFAFGCACAGLFFAVKAGTSTGASITGLVITLIALMFSGVWFSQVKKGLDKMQRERQERSR
jgi:hypothetical protein